MLCCLPHQPSLNDCRLRQVGQLLEASLALGETSEVAPQLRQRLRQCEVAAIVLSSPLTVVSRLCLVFYASMEGCSSCGTMALLAPLNARGVAPLC